MKQIPNRKMTVLSTNGKIMAILDTGVSNCLHLQTRAMTYVHTIQGSHFNYAFQGKKGIEVTFKYYSRMNKAEHAVQSYAAGVKYLSMEGFENVGTY